MGFIITVLLAEPRQHLGRRPARSRNSSPRRAHRHRTRPAAPQATPLTLEPTPPPVNAEEDAALKAFREARNDGPAKKEQIAEEFLAKYPQSRYRPEIYAWQVQLFPQQGRDGQDGSGGG